MIELKDQMNQTIRLEKTPERIVSLVPSQTELLYDLGLGDKVVGITKFCIHPEAWFRSKTRVGGTKNVNHEVIASLKPDLIIGNKEENAESDIESLKMHYSVYMSDIFTVNDALKMIKDLGDITAKKQEADRMATMISQDFQAFPEVSGSVLYLIWADPFMAAGDHTFIGDLIQRFGLKNVIAGADVRYAELTSEQIRSLNPDYLFLSSEPFPFKETHAAELAELTNAKIYFTDGEMFSWYGSRMTLMKPYFTELRSQMKDNLQ